MVNGNKIKSYISSNKITQAEFAQQIGVSTPTISKLINKYTCDLDTLLLVADGMNVSLDYLFDRNINNEKYPIDSDKITKIHKPAKYMEKILETQEITLYDIKAAANLKTMFIDKNQNILGTIRLPNIPKCDGAMYVTGDSMDPIIKSGDIICYKEINDFNNIIYGDMYLVAIDNDGDEYLTIKYVTHSDKGEGWIRLESYNPRHSPQDFDIRCITALALVKISIRMNTM